MTIQERISDANARLGKFYLQRQKLSMQAQQIQIASAQVDQELIKVNGEVEILEQLLSEDKVLEIAKNPVGKAVL